MTTDMRKILNILNEQADADNMYGDSSKLTTFGRKDGQEFTDRGRGNVKPRANMDARFADNPMGDEQLDEFMDGGDAFSPDPTQMEKLHQALLHAGQDDQSIMQGVNLTDNGKRKLAAALGLSPDEIGILISSLVQKLRSDDSRSTDALIDDYYTTMGEGADVPMVINTMGNLTERKWVDNEDLADKDAKKERDANKKKARKFKDKQKKVEETRRDEKGKKRPFNQGAVMELLSYEPDSSGNVTIRNSETGDEKYLQGSEATSLLAKLKAGADPQATLAPLMEETMNHESSSHGNDFMSEIEASAGTYNFPWKYGHQHGFATMMYHATEKPVFKLESVRDDTGDEIDDIDSTMYADLMQQAKDFIGHE